MRYTEQTWSLTVPSPLTLISRRSITEKQQIKRRGRNMKVEKLSGGNIVVLPDKGKTLSGSLTEIIFKVIREYTGLETLSIPVINLPVRFIGVAKRDGDKVILDGPILKILIQVKGTIKYSIIDKLSGKKVAEEVIQEAFEYV